MIAVSAALSLLCLGPSSAGAAIQLGQLPTGNPFCPFAFGGVNGVQSSSSSGTPYEVPSGGGVITSWRHRGRNTAPGSGRLQVWRPSGGTSYTLVGRSDLASFAAGVVSEFPTQVPVSGGDLLGLRSEIPAGCEFTAGAGDQVGYEGSGASDPAPGETRDLGSASSFAHLNVSATLEPDADGDGFGDETQDQCAGDASLQGPCADTTIIEGPKDKTKKRKTKFEFTSNVPDASFQCAVDDEALNVPCTSPYKVKVKKGRHTFQVRAVSPGGVPDATPATDAWKVKRRKK